MLRRKKFLIKLAKKMPNKQFFCAPIIKKFFQLFLDKQLANSMELFDYFGFKIALCLGANPNIDSKIKKGYHLVTRCARSGDYLLLDTLLQFGGDINGGETTGGYLPIHMAATKGHANSVEILIQYGTDINSIYLLKDNGGNILFGEKGWTPLICACKHNKVDVVILLLSLGANHLDTDELGVSALDIATKLKNREMIKAIYHSYDEPFVTPKNKI